MASKAFQFEVGPGIYARPVALVVLAPVLALFGATPWDRIVLAISVALCLKGLIYQLTTRITVNGTQMFYATGIFDRTNHQIDLIKVESVVLRPGLGSVVCNDGDVLVKIPAEMDIRLRSVTNYRGLGALLERNAGISSKAAQNA